MHVSNQFLRVTKLFNVGKYSQIEQRLGRLERAVACMNDNAYSTIQRPEAFHKTHAIEIRQTQIDNRHTKLQALELRQCFGSGSTTDDLKHFGLHDTHESVQLRRIILNNEQAREALALGCTPHTACLQGCRDGIVDHLSSDGLRSASDIRTGIGLAWSILKPLAHQRGAVTQS